MLLTINPYYIPGIPSQQNVISYVANSLGVTVDEVMSRNRKGDALIGRQVAQYVLRVHYNLSFPAIAKIFRVNNATVIHNVNKINLDIEHLNTFPKSTLIRPKKVTDLINKFKERSK